ncbi:MAG: serine/threonine-protein phosphatase, partial [Nocardioides sp.]
MSDGTSARPGPQPTMSARLSTWANRILPSGRRTLAGLVLATVVIGVGLWIEPDVVPMVSLLLPLVVSSLVLGPRDLPWFVVFVLLVLATIMPRQPDITVRVAASVVIMFSLGFLILLASFRRSRLGVAGVQGESMLVDLRDRILRQAGIPALPAEWYAASEIRSAGGTPFAGDFIVAVRVGDRLDVAVVDVSGKGEGAGTRALLLSGA